MSGSRDGLGHRVAWFFTNWREYDAPLATKVRLTMSFNGAPYTIPAGDRVGVALSVERANTQADALSFMYDHPNHPTRLEIETSTPLDGG